MIQALVPETCHSGDRQPLAPEARHSPVWGGPERDPLAFIAELHLEQPI